jgi:hypothetical protein
MLHKIQSKIFVGATLFLLPLVSSAQFTDGNGDIRVFGDRIVLFISEILVPFVFSIALLFFIYGVYLYFIKGGSEEDARVSGRSYIIWSIVGFVVMVSVWGITNLIAGGLGFNDPDGLKKGDLPRGATTRS